MEHNSHGERPVRNESWSVAVSVFCVFSASFAEFLWKFSGAKDTNYVTALTVSVSAHLSPCGHHFYWGRKGLPWFWGTHSAGYTHVRGIFLFHFFIKPDRKYLESLHLTDFLGIKHVPGEVSISLAINFKGSRIIEMTEQVFDFHFSNLLPFSHSLAWLMLCI